MAENEPRSSREGRQADDVGPLQLLPYLPILGYSKAIALLALSDPDVTFPIDLLEGHTRITTAERIGEGKGDEAEPESFQKLWHGPAVRHPTIKTPPIGTDFRWAVGYLT